MGKKRNKKTKKKKANEIEIWTQEQYEEYMAGLYGMDFVAGFTDGGIPYGIFEDETGDDEKEDENVRSSQYTDEDLPF